jgi:hypothetical protein
VESARARWVPSLLHGLVRFDEVASGDIDHVLHLTLPRIRSGAAWWPAFHSDGREARPDAVPMGAWFRLRSDVSVSGLGPQARIVAQALRDHGAILADTGAEAATIMGEPDLRWDDRDLAGLGRLTLSDFEIVDPADMIVDPATHQIR